MKEPLFQKLVCYENIPYFCSGFSSIMAAPVSICALPVQPQQAICVQTVNSGRLFLSLTS